MPIDDKRLEIMLRQLKEDALPDSQDIMRGAIVNGILSAFPVGGDAVKSLIEGKATRNINRRIIELFHEMREQLQEIEDSIPDENYFGSEEFQTLLALGIEQLKTTHDEGKRKMVADALANSGSAEFISDDKEQYVRILRDLSPADAGTLRELASIHERTSGSAGLTMHGGGTTSSLARLTALGLVDESFKAPAPRTDQRQPPPREYQISADGRRFIQFTSGGANNKENLDANATVSKSEESS